MSHKVPRDKIIPWDLCALLAAAAVLTLSLCLMLAASVSAQVAEATSSCNVPSVTEMEPTALTCRFSINVNVTRQNFTVVHKGCETNIGADILSCSWLKEQLSCATAPGYEFNNTVTDHLVISVPRASRDNNGTYACHVLGSKLQGFDPCECIISPDASPNTTLVIVALWIIVTPIIIINISIIIFFLKHGRRQRHSGRTRRGDGGGGDGGGGGGEGGGRGGGGSRGGDRRGGGGGGSSGGGGVKGLLQGGQTDYVTNIPEELLAGRERHRLLDEMKQKTGADVQLDPIVAVTPPASPECTNAATHSAATIRQPLARPGVEPERIHREPPLLYKSWKPGGGHGARGHYPFKAENLQCSEDPWISVGKDDAEMLEKVVRVRMAGIKDPVLAKNPGAKEMCYIRMHEELLVSAEERNFDWLNRALKNCMAANLQIKGEIEYGQKVLMALCQEEMEKAVKSKKLEELRECINKIENTCVANMAREQAWFQEGQEEIKRMLLSQRKKDDANVGKPPDHVTDVIVAAFILIGESEEELDTWQKVAEKLKETNEEQLIEQVNNLDYSLLTQERVDLAAEKLERAVGTFADYRSIEKLKNMCLEKKSFYQTRGRLKKRN